MVHVLMSTGSFVRAYLKQKEEIHVIIKTNLTCTCVCTFDSLEIWSYKVDSLVADPLVRSNFYSEQNGLRKQLHYYQC